MSKKTDAYANYTVISAPNHDPEFYMTAEAAEKDIRSMINEELIIADDGDIVCIVQVIKRLKVKYGWELEEVG